jgi:cupin fold WbuC family metalloprotein
MANAFPNPEGALLTVDDALLRRGLEASRQNERKRMIYPMHRKQDAPVQRMLNFLQPGTYIRPHLHPREGAIESMYLMQGAIRFMTFDESGNLLAIRDCGGPQEPALIDIEAKVWHSFLVREPDTILFEVKMGPYDADLDKTFASWAPEEGSHEAQHFMNQLEQQASAFLTS